MPKGKIVIITSGWFPEGDAGAVRLQTITKIMTACEYEVTVLCRGNANENGNYEGASYISLRRAKGGFVKKLFDYLQFTKRVKEYLNNTEGITHIYLYSTAVSVFVYCKKFAKNKNIKLIYDCVEWYSPEEFAWGKLDYNYIAKNKVNSVIVDSQFSVVAISRYLEDYYSKKNIPTIRIPVLCDVKGREMDERCKGETLTLFYAGCPYTKDLVGNALEALLLLNEDERRRVKIVLVGTKKEVLISKSHIKEQTILDCGSSLEIFSRIPRKQVLQMMTNADFVMLFRDPSKRYAQAGFPSKVVEALANSTPIFCNYSSDLELYLKDGENAIVSSSHSPGDIAEAIRKALNLRIEDKEKMARKAFVAAGCYFDYRNYIDMAASFLGK